MKLDYEYLKKILTTMEEQNEYYIYASELMKNVYNAENRLDIDHKFVGHIKVLFDIGCIEAEQGRGTGFSLTPNRGFIFADLPYRMTAKGYEFLDMLKNETIFNKIKNLAISNALDVGKQMLVAWGIKQITGS